MSQSGGVVALLGCTGGKQWGFVIGDEQVPDETIRGPNRGLTIGHLRFLRGSR